jgi:hypothetical protein
MQKADRVGEWVLLAAALFIAALCARDYAGSWNDGSRLATVEALVDHQTFAIDRSIFVQVPPGGCPLPCPYRDPDHQLTRTGTCDKLWIHNHYYSDKSPVPALWLAGCYRLWQQATDVVARQQPAAFCKAMTLLSSGLAYVACLLCLYRLTRLLQLPLELRFAFAGSLGLGTTLLPYACHVNNHILLLAVAMALTLHVAALSQECAAGLLRWQRVASLGLLAGLGYTIDLGTGPILLLATAALVAVRCRRWRSLFHFCLAALPWLVLHHALNYSIGGTFRPANAVAEYFRWPGSPFDSHNLTGHWVHAGPGPFLLYAASMLFGKRGFVGHNLVLFLLLPGVVLLLRRRGREWPEVAWAGLCWGGAWLLYAATSNNSSGQCCSIRWFLPLLAPSYYLLALVVRDFPDRRRDFLLLSFWGAVLVIVGMREGPWMKHMATFFWQIQALALFSWVLSRLGTPRGVCRLPAEPRIYQRRPLRFSLSQAASGPTPVPE